MSNENPNDNISKIILGIMAIPVLILIVWLINEFFFMGIVLIALLISTVGQMTGRR